MRVADQMIYRWKDDPDHNINVFVRPMIAPQQDRNLINFSINAGLTIHEPLPGRGSDMFGLGMGFARVSNSATGFDQDTALFNPGVYSPVRHSETLHRGDLSISGHALVADPAGHSIRLQSGWWHRQSEQPD